MPTHALGEVAGDMFRIRNWKHLSAVLNLLGLSLTLVGSLLLIWTLTVKPSEFRLVKTSTSDMALCLKDKRVATGFGGPLVVTTEPCPEWQNTGPTAEVVTDKPAYADWGFA
jgi:hypothetical protein